MWDIEIISNVLVSIGYFPEGYGKDLAMYMIDQIKEYAESKGYLWVTVIGWIEKEK